MELSRIGLQTQVWPGQAWIQEEGAGGDCPSQTNFLKNPSNYTIENYVREIKNVKNENKLSFPEVKKLNISMQ